MSGVPLSRAEVDAYLDLKRKARITALLAEAAECREAPFRVEWWAQRRNQKTSQSMPTRDLALALFREEYPKRTRSKYDIMTGYGSNGAYFSIEWTRI